MMLDPSLRGKPVAVCGSTESRHGIVLAKSQLAKKAGVKTGMVNWEARQRCPNLIMVPPQYDQYLKYSKLAHEIYYAVTAIDGSEELSRRAEKLIGIPVRCMLFSEIDYDSEFDAAWACSSLLHVPKAEMPDVIHRICKALKPGGLFYASYKYGEHERQAAGRTFSDYTEQDLPELTGYGPDLSLVDHWISEDVRPGRKHEKWLNIIWKKNV